MREKINTDSQENIGLTVILWITADGTKWSYVFVLKRNNNGGIA